MKIGCESRTSDSLASRTFPHETPESSSCTHGVIPPSAETAANALPAWQPSPSIRTPFELQMEESTSGEAKNGVKLM